MEGESRRAVSPLCAAAGFWEVRYLSSCFCSRCWRACSPTLPTVINHAVAGSAPSPWGSSGCGAGWARGSAAVEGFLRFLWDTWGATRQRWHIHSALRGDGKGLHLSDWVKSTLGRDLWVQACMAALLLLHPCLVPVPAAWAACEPPGLGDLLVHMAGRFFLCFEGWEEIWALFQKQNKSKSKLALGVKCSRTTQ